MIHLDTNFLVQALRPGTIGETKLRQWLQNGESRDHCLFPQPSQQQFFGNGWMAVPAGAGPEFFRLMREAENGP